MAEELHDLQADAQQPETISTTINSNVHQFPFIPVPQLAEADENRTRPEDGFGRVSELSLTDCIAIRLARE